MGLGGSLFLQVFFVDLFIANTWGTLTGFTIKQVLSLVSVWVLWPQVSYIQPRGVYVNPTLSNDMRTFWSLGFTLFLKELRILDSLLRSASQEPCFSSNTPVTPNFKQCSHSLTFYSISPCVTGCPLLAASAQHSSVMSWGGRRSRLLSSLFFSLWFWIECLDLSLFMNHLFVTDLSQSTTQVYLALFPH